MRFVYQSVRDPSICQKSAAIDHMSIAEDSGLCGSKKASGGRNGRGVWQSLPRREPEIKASPKSRNTISGLCRVNFHVPRNRQGLTASLGILGSRGFL